MTNIENSKSSKVLITSVFFLWKSLDNSRVLTTGVSRILNFTWISGDLFVNRRSIFNRTEHMFKTYSCLSVDFNPLEHIAYVGDEFYRIEIDIEQSCVNHVEHMVKTDWMVVITNRSPEIHVKYQVQLIRYLIWQDPHSY